MVLWLFWSRLISFFEVRLNVCSILCQFWLVVYYLSQLDYQIIEHNSNNAKTISRSFLKNVVFVLTRYIYQTSPNPKTRSKCFTLSITNNILKLVMFQFFQAYVGEYFLLSNSPNHITYLMRIFIWIKRGKRPSSFQLFNDEVILSKML